MAMNLHEEQKIDDVTYQLTTTVDDGNNLVLNLLGTDDTGEVRADGRMRLPSEGGTDVAALVARTLKAISRMQQPRKNRAVNANAPWTDELDARLYQEWMAPSDRDTVHRLRELGTAMGRSATAIRARLPRIGCDPDVVGRELSPEGKAFFGVKAS